MSCASNNPEKLEPVKLAGNLRGNEVEKYPDLADSNISTVVENNSPGREADDFESRGIIAQMLQMQFEEDDKFKFMDEKDFEGYSEEEVIVDISYDNDWDTLDTLGKKSVCVPLPVIKGKKNRETSEFATVSVNRDTCRLSSKVFNSLEIPSYNEEFRRYKVQHGKKKRPTSTLLGIDEHAWQTIREMIKDQLFLKVVDILSFSNEAVILRGWQSWPEPQKYCSRIVPIKCTITVIRMNLKHPKSKVNACQKAEKVAADYERLKTAGIPCLNLIAQRGHVLVSSNCGKLLSDCRGREFSQMWLKHKPKLTSGQIIYSQVRDLMKNYYEANLIHTHLSEQNIAYDVWITVRIIHISPCVERSDTDALNYLFRNCTNIINFFKRARIRNIPEPDKLFRYITGYYYTDKLSLAKLQKSIQTKAV